MSVQQRRALEALRQKMVTVQRHLAQAVTDWNEVFPGAGPAVRLMSHTGQDTLDAIVVVDTMLEALPAEEKS